MFEASESPALKPHTSKSTPRAKITIATRGDDFMGLTPFRVEHE
jgi:hypothetical protein